MAFFSHALSPADPVAIRAPKRGRRGLFARLADALLASRQQDANRAIAAYLAHTGGRLTDSVEREIERRFFGEPRV
ncbi:MAG TPA: hypothetical protein VFL51_05060 [Pseudolabrys sp.]|nr:hypothetical protein [Pseudolabrys sp.]